MEARLKPDCKWSVIRALAGQEYVKYEWRPVPAERQAEAEAHPDLETREPPADPFGPQSEPAPLVETPAKGRGRKGSAR